MNGQHLKEYILSLKEDYGIPACDCSVWQSHRCVYRCTDGYADEAHKRETAPGDLWWLYSVTKLFTAAAAIRMLEKGILKADEAVSELLPEYGKLSVRTAGGIAPAKRPMTVRHLLTMTCGLSYQKTEALRRLSEYKGPAANRAVSRALAGETLAFEPGEHFLYGYGFDVLASVMEEAGGKSFEQILRDEVFTPLGLTHTGFTPTDAEKSRFQTQYRYDFRSGAFQLAGQANTEALCQEHDSGGAGLYSTAGDVMLLADCLACGGVSQNGERFLRRESVEMLSRNALNDVQLKDFSSIGTVPPGYGYGFGVRTLIDKAASPGPVGEFGWSGAAGSWVLCDPKNRIAMVFMMHVLNFMPAFREIHVKLRDLLYEDLENEVNE